ncbi:MAG: peptide chain release factor aRF-1 [archaeon]
MTDEQQLHELKKKLRELRSKRGRHTELITVYIADGYNLDKAAGRLFEEQGTASNIKSATTRKNVGTALTKILQHFKQFKQTPKNGLAVFCGNVSENEGRDDFLMESITPPKPLNMNLYRCSQKFVLEPLEDMLESRETYGLIVIERQHADIAFLKGTRLDIVESFDSLIPGKFRAGGQSAQRFARMIEGMANDFYKEVSEAANTIFKKEENLKGIIVGGPGPTKTELMDKEHIHTDLREKVLGILDIGYTGEQGLRELIEKSDDILKEAAVMKEKHLVDKFLGHLGKDTGLATYGEEDVRKALAMGAIEVLMLSEDLDEEKIEELTETAQQTATEVQIISNETREGQQISQFGGYAAILRFKVEG